MVLPVLGSLAVAVNCNDISSESLVSEHDFGDAAASSSSSGSSGAPNSDAGGLDASPTDDSGEPSGLDPSYQHFARNYVLCTGQSLSVGAVGAPALSLEQPYDNQMFVGGVLTPDTAEARASFVPLVERNVETMESGFANRAHELATPLLAMRPAEERSHRMLVSCHGVGGYSYAQLKKDTAPYANGLAQLEAAVALSAAASESLIVRGVTNVHGESDHLGQNPDYEASLVEWQANLEADVQQRTGQSAPVPMFHTQMSSFTMFGSSFSAVTQAQWQSHLHHPRVLVMVGPKYMLPYVEDGVHLSNEGYRWLGEYHAKAYAREILEGKPWEPLRPLAASRDGVVVTLEYLVPSPPLVLDTTLVSDPGNYGFQAFDDAGPIAIGAVAVRDATHVTLTLASKPGANLRIRYAFQAAVGAHAGPAEGARGNLRDSDATPSSYGNTLYNWSLHFELPVP